MSSLTPSQGVMPQGTRPGNAASTIPIDPALQRRPEDVSNKTRRSDFKVDEAEWEYEYDEDESEIFYLTLDLGSSHIPRNQSGSQQPKTSSDQPSFGAQRSPSHQNKDERDDTAQTAATSSAQAPNAVQILDLHGSNPLVSYQNQVFDCQWASNIGTELLFTEPDSDVDGPALRSTPAYKLLAASSMRVISKPVQLVPPEEATVRRQDIMGAPEAQGDRPSQDGTRSGVSMGGDAPRSTKHQFGFLEKLMELKKAKGEKDEVTIYAKKAQTGPSSRARARARKDGEATQATASLAELNELRVRRMEGDEEAGRRLQELERPNFREQQLEREGMVRTGVREAAGRQRGRARGRRARGSRGRASLLSNLMGNGDAAATGVGLDAALTGSFTPMSWTSDSNAGALPAERDTTHGPEASTPSSAMEESTRTATSPPQSNSSATDQPVEGDEH
ncbi:MAG: hypothetical protein M1817_000955 [Caeruleum heppii]|nr:MAG: hypothetical protein M1817_000955 [Caeruleum heppii]